MTERMPRERWIDHWTTVAVTALPPGWRNVYREGDGTRSEVPCPAIVLQELRSTDHCYDIAQPDGTFRLHTHREHHEPPYDTRAVFADHECGYLEPADDSRNYVCALGPGEQISADGLSEPTFPGRKHPPGEVQTQHNQPKETTQSCIA